METYLRVRTISQAEIGQLSVLKMNLDAAILNYETAQAEFQGSGTLQLHNVVI